MYELLNLRADPMVVALDKTKNNLALSMESLPDLQADYLVISSGYGANSAGSKEAAAKRYEELREDPLWQTLPAVQDGTCSTSIPSSGMRTAHRERNGHPGPRGLAWL